MIDIDKLILVGVIAAAKGIKGEAVIKSFTEEKTNLVNLNLQNDKGSKMWLKLVRTDKKGDLICRVNNYQTRNEIESLQGTKLFCHRKDLPETLANEFYIVDLVGRAVVDKSGKSIGIVRNVANFGAGDLIEIEFNNNSRELFNFNNQNFPEINDEYMVFIPPIIAK